MQKFQRKMLNKTIKHQKIRKKTLLAFNIQELSQLNALASCCKKLKKKSICQFSKNYFLYFEKFYNLSEIIRHYKKKNLFFFLDHCTDFKIIKKCLKYDFDGIMYDGSNLSLKKNIINTNKVYNLIKNKKKKVMLEAEIGPVLGIEDDHVSKSKNKISKSALSKFIKTANFDLLAIGAGNAHGLNKNVSIEFDLLKYAIDQKKDINLVFHGGSGVSKSILDKSIRHNTVKINFSSSLKLEMAKLNLVFSKKNKIFDKLKYNDFIKKKLFNFFCNKLEKFS